MQIAQPNRSFPLSAQAGPSDARFSRFSPASGKTVNEAFRHSGGNKVVREFPAGSLEKNIDPSSPSNNDEVILWEAQATIKHATAMMEQVRDYDNKAVDDNPEIGKFEQTYLNKTRDGSEGGIQADLREGSSGFSQHIVNSYSDGTVNHIYAYFQESADCKVYGFKDGGGAKEVLVSPNGLITVFSDH